MHCGNWSVTCCPFKDVFQENKLNEEIDWGISIRKNRFQEREIILQEEPSELFVAKKKTKRKKKKCMNALIDKCTCVQKKIPVCRKLSEKFELIQRDTLTYRQYINFLAQPKIPFCPEPPDKPYVRKKPMKICSPRCTQLALPARRRIYCNWKDYYQTLTEEQVLFLKELLNKKEALVPLDAYKYFQRLSREQKKLKKLKKKKEKDKIITKPKKSKIIREINCLSSCIVDYFANKMLQQVKCSHMFLTSIMKMKLEENHLIKPGYRRDKQKDICGKTLYDTLDQVSVWLECNIGFRDDESDLGSESVSSITYSDVEREYICEAMGEEEEEEEVEEEMLEEEGPIELLWKEESVKAEEAEEIELPEEEAVEEPEIIIEEIMSEEKVEEEPEVEIEVEEEIEAEETIEIIETPVEIYDEGEEIVEPEPVVEKLPSDTALESVADILNELIMNATQERALRIEEHSPDAVCCVTLKTWATWLVDVAQNTHSWCQWIQEVIARVRFFAAILKGEVKTKEGKTRILYKEEWQQFTETLAQDIEAWQKYKSHVKELSDQIIEGFQNKRVICCKACLQSKLIISAETAHQVTEQLVEALNTTAYWRGWLDAIVDEAKKLACLQFDLPSAEAVDTSSSSYESSTSYIIEIIEIKSPSTKSASDTSMFVLEELEKDKDSKDDDSKDADSHDTT